MQEPFVINIGRQFGSGGRRIGELLAARLGIRLYDKELINLAAEQSGFGIEHFEKADEQERKGMLTTLIGWSRTLAGGFTPTRDPLSNEALFKIQSDVIRSVAERESCIFVGRCADYILRDHPRALNIFVTASDEARIRRITDRSGCSEEEARRLLERVDAGRAHYYDYYTSRTWGAAATYHLCIDSSAAGDEQTAEFILACAAHKLNLNIRP